MVIYNTSLFVASIIFSFQVFVCVCAHLCLCVCMLTWLTRTTFLLGSITAFLFIINLHDRLAALCSSSVCVCVCASKMPVLLIQHWHL